MESYLKVMLSAWLFTSPMSRGLHSSTSQLNLSRVYHPTHPTHPKHPLPPPEHGLHNPYVHPLSHTTCSS